MFENLIQCEKCGLIYYDKAQDIDIDSLYDESYFKGEEYLDYKNDKSIIQKNFTQRLTEIRKYIKSGNLFEIGCAYGFFLDVARKNFKVRGIDITDRPIDYAKNTLGLNVTRGSYLDHAITDKLDAICLWDTIEHLESPERFIEKIGSDLKSGGYLFLTTGDIGSLLAKVRKSKWRMIHPPTHLFYFSKKTIAKLLKEYGLEVVEISHPGIYRSLKQILYSLFFLKKKNPPKIFEAVFKNFDIPIYINTFDIMMVVARKI